LSTRAVRDCKLRQGQNLIRIQIRISGLIRIGMCAGSVSECCRFIMSCLSSVYCPSRGHISKTKQDRSVVTMKHYIEVGTTYTVAASRSSSRHSWGDTLVADVENVFNCPVWLWRQDPGVVNRVQPSESVVNTHHSLVYNIHGMMQKSNRSLFIVLWWTCKLWSSNFWTSVHRVSDVYVNHNFIVKGSSATRCLGWSGWRPDWQQGIVGQRTAEWRFTKGQTWYMLYV